MEKSISLTGWTGSPPFNPEPQIYLLAGGHGCEDIGFKDRARLPPGYKMMVFNNKCGSFTLIDEKYIQLIQLLTDIKNKDLFSHIEDTFESLKKYLGASMSLYLPGDKYPNLYYTPFLSLANNTLAIASGIRKFPIVQSTVLDSITENNNVYPTMKAFDLTGSEDEFEDIYKDSIFPVTSTAKRIFLEAGKDYSRFTNVLKVSVKECMENLGPGLYIFLACRNATCPFPVESLFREKYLTNMNRYEPLYRNIPGHYEEILKVLGRKNDSLDRSIVNRIRLVRQNSMKQQKAREAAAATKKARRGGRRRATRRANP